jgi:hypothetical protein
MTTPERLRRRQRIEGTFLIIIGVLMLVQALYFQHQDNVQRRCIQDQFSKLAKSYTARANINERDSKAKTKVIMGVASAPDQATVTHALQDYVVEQQQIDKDREANPVPPFPLGRCE